MFTYFDVVVSVIIVITTLTSLARGFVMDLVSVMVWIGAGVLTLYFFPYAAVWMEEWFRSSMLINIAAVICVYLASLTVLGAFGSLFANNSKQHRFGVMDRVMGGGFGFLKGFIIVSLIHFSISEVAGGDEPEWLQGETYEYTKAGAEWLDDIVMHVFEKGIEVLEGEAESPDIDEGMEGIAPEIEDMVEEL